MYVDGPGSPIRHFRSEANYHAGAEACHSANRGDTTGMKEDILGELRVPDKPIRRCHANNFPDERVVVGGLVPDFCRVKWRQLLDSFRKPLCCDRRASTAGQLADGVAKAGP